MFALELSELKLAGATQKMFACCLGLEGHWGADRSQHHLQKQAYARHKPPPTTSTVDNSLYP